MVLFPFSPTSYCIDYQELVFFLTLIIIVVIVIIAIITMQIISVYATETYCHESLSLSTENLKALSHLSHHRVAVLHSSSTIQLLDF